MTENFRFVQTDHLDLGNAPHYQWGSFVHMYMVKNHNINSCQKLGSLLYWSTMLYHMTPSKTSQTKDDVIPFMAWISYRPFNYYCIVINTLHAAMQKVLVYLKFWNFRGYFRTYQSNTRNVCTYLNVFLTLISNIIIWHFKIETFLTNLRHFVPTSSAVW